MRNKGFFWFLTILLTAICLYQLSFTWVSNSVETKAAKEADARVAELKEKALKGDTVEYLPNGTAVDFRNAEAEELAKAAFINEILREKAEKEVYPVFGSTFKEVKSRSLAFGLDLVGGMSVTLEVSIPDLVKNFARNGGRDNKFKRPFEAAVQEYGKNGGDFIDVFVAKHNELNSGKKLVDLFDVADIDELGVKSSDQEVIDFLKELENTSMKGIQDIMERRINQFGVAQPNIQLDPASNRLYIELPGVQDEETVREKLKSTANLQFFEMYEVNQIGANWDRLVALSINASTDELEVEEPETTDSTDMAGSEEEGDSLNLAATDDSTEMEDEGSFDLPSTNENDPNAVKGLAGLFRPYGYKGILVWVSSTNKGAVDKIINNEQLIREAGFPEDMAFMWGAQTEELEDEVGYFLYTCKIPLDGEARVGGSDIKKATRGYDSEGGKVTVDLEMTNEGDGKWSQMTLDNKGHMVAITMDSVVYSAPNVNEQISGGRTQISGSFSVSEANDLAGLLNGGALPTRCVIKEQTKVGPTIGAENSRAGLYSFGFALLLVFVYMIFYYGKAGIVADIALFANILFIFGSLASFGAVLTLSGIAGIVLTIGMAVDANVLIFERIREEQAAGKDLKSSIDTGFKKALSSIIDANVTTMLTAIVLKVFGAGPIESFATTLIIGIFTSVFAALVITRLSINFWMSRGKTINFESRVTKNAFKNFNFNFIGKRKMYYGISAVLIVLSLAAIGVRGLSESVEFSGGQTFGVKFEKTTEGKIESVRKELAKVFQEDGESASFEVKTKTNNYFLEITTNYKLGSNEAEAEVKEALLAGLKNVEDELGVAMIQESRSVSKTVSDEMIQSSTIAIVLSLIIIFGYILMRFGKWQYSTGAIIAMTHDVTIVLGIFAGLHGFLPWNMDVDQAFIAAILTVIGYSINDTVIVFDRIRENLGLHKGTDEHTNINNSLNSTLSRTINTSATTFIVLLIIFLFGGTAIKGFILALMIGVIVGTYSSVCIATPILVDFTKKKGIKKSTEAVETAKA